MVEVIICHLRIPSAMKAASAIASAALRYSYLSPVLAVVILPEKKTTTRKLVQKSPWLLPRVERTGIEKHQKWEGVVHIKTCWKEEIPWQSS